MAQKSLEMVVAAVAAGLSDGHSVVDVKPQKQLRSLGIQGKQFDQFKRRLYRTLSREGAQKFAEFSNLDISPTSTIKEVVSVLPKTYQKTLPVGRGKGVTPQVRTAVRAAVAQATIKHSVFEVTAEKKLSDLGLYGSKIPEIRVNLYNALSPVGKNRLKFQDYVTVSGIKPSATIKEISEKSLELFQKQPGRRRLPFADRIGSLPGTEGKKRKFPRRNLTGDETIKVKFPNPVTKSPNPKKSKS